MPAARTLEPVALDVSELITDISPLAEAITRAESIELNINTRKGLWMALADPAQLESALLNLCLNARDALTGSGKLTIVDRQCGARRRLHRRSGRTGARGVRDAGVYPTTVAAFQGNIWNTSFEPSFIRPKPTGTGLGLSMVYGLVKQLGGHARIYSEPGQGTTVKLYLRRADQGEAGPLKARAAPDQLQGTETILVVEDNDLVRANACKPTRRSGIIGSLKPAMPNRH